MNCHGIIMCIAEFSYKRYISNPAAVVSINSYSCILCEEQIE